MANNPRLIILSEHFRGQTFDLTEEKYSVGRSEECDIPISGATLSGHHCTLERSDETGNYVLIDHGSTNGTRINGVLVDKQELNNSDILQLGNIEILYDSPQGGTPTGNSSSMTGINLQQDTADRDNAFTEMTNFSPFDSNAAGNASAFHESKIAKLSMLAFLGIASLGVLGLLVWFIFEVTS